MKVKRPVDRNELQNAIHEVEKRSTFVSLKDMFRAVSETPWATTHRVTASVAAHRFVEFGLTCKTKPGKRGRPAGPRKEIDLMPADDETEETFPDGRPVKPTPRVPVPVTRVKPEPPPAPAPAPVPVPAGTRIDPMTGRVVEPPIDVWELVEIFKGHGIDVWGWADILTSDYDDAEVKQKKVAAWKELRRRYNTLIHTGGKSSKFADN